MISWLIKKVIGSKNQRLLKTLRGDVARIVEIEKEYQTLSLDALRAKVAGWKSEAAKIEDDFEVNDYLNRILPEAFAAVKNAARRLCAQSFMVCDQPCTWNMVHFDVQLLGALFSMSTSPIQYEFDLQGMPRTWAFSSHGCRIAGRFPARSGSSTTMPMSAPPTLHRPRISLARPGAFRRHDAYA